MSALFTTRTVWIVSALVVVSLATGIGLAVFSDELDAREPAWGADAYSPSAIGHAALIDLLRDLDRPVVVSRGDSPAKARGGVLVVAAPHVQDDRDKARLRELVATKDAEVLVVLPKWIGDSHPTHPGWIDHAGPLAVEEIAEVLTTLGLPAELATQPSTAPVSVADGRVAPAQRGTWQLLPAVDGLDVHVEVGGAVLVGRPSDDGWDEGAARPWLLTDPDPMSNHGLGHGDNARFIVELLDELRDGGPIVFDETHHGYARDPSPFRPLFEYPMVLGTIQGVLCLVVLVWATIGRFGPPAASPPAIAAGKEFLIHNTASLLRFGGHDADALRRYLAHAITDVRRAVHAPRELRAASLTSWLDELARVSGVTESMAELERQVELVLASPRGGRPILEVAERIHRWRRDMIHGSRKHS